MKNQPNRPTFAGAPNFGNPRRYDQQNLDALIAKSKSSNLAGYVAGGLGAGIIAGAGAAFLATEANAQNLDVDVDQMHEDMQAIEAPEVQETAEESAQPVVLVRETHIIHHHVPAAQQADGDLPVHTPGDGFYAMNESGSIVYMELQELEGVPVLAEDWNLDGDFDVYVLPTQTENGGPRVIEGPGLASMEFDDQNQPLLVAQPPAGITPVGYEDVTTEFMNTYANVEPNDPPVVVDDGGGSDPTILVDGGDDGDNDDGGGVLADNGNNGSDDDPVDFDSDGGDPNDGSVLADDGGDVVNYDDSDIPEPEPYVADVPSSDGMSDFVNDANVDMLA